jgi:biotin-dependent carboxylase-like uncharacterized protein
MPESTKSAENQASRTFQVVRAGVQNSVQDLGRHGMRHLGISQNGALDHASLILANRLVGNHDNAAGLEIVVGPVVLKFESDVWFSICGADFNSSLDGQAVPPAWRVRARAGQTLKLHHQQQELLAYIAIDGGIDVPEILGARATDLQAGFGGWQGRALKSGDQIPLGSCKQFSKAIGVHQRLWTPEVRAIPGPEYAQFDLASHKAFWQQAWRVSPNSNRMAYRLLSQASTHTSEQALHRTSNQDLASHGVIPGVIQVPPNGQPIVLMADAQTTGGYPRIATVIEADLWKIAQMRPGQTFCFSQVDLASALAAQEHRQQNRNRIEWNRYAL